MRTCEILKKSGKKLIFILMGIITVLLFFSCELSVSFSIEDVTDDQLMGIAEDYNLNPEMINCEFGDEGIPIKDALTYFSAKELKEYGSENDLYAEYCSPTEEDGIFEYKIPRDIIEEWLYKKFFQIYFADDKGLVVDDNYIFTVNTKESTNQEGSMVYNVGSGQNIVLFDYSLMTTSYKGEEIEDTIQRFRLCKSDGNIVIKSVEKVYEYKEFDEFTKDDVTEEELFDIFQFCDNIWIIPQVESQYFGESGLPIKSGYYYFLMEILDCLWDENNIYSEYLEIVTTESGYERYDYYFPREVVENWIYSKFYKIDFTGVEEFLVDNRYYITAGGIGGDRLSAPNRITNINSENNIVTFDAITKNIDRIVIVDKYTLCKIDGNIIVKSIEFKESYQEFDDFTEQDITEKEMLNLSSGYIWLSVCLNFDDICFDETGIPIRTGIFYYAWSQGLWEGGNKDFHQYLIDDFDYQLGNKIQAIECNYKIPRELIDNWLWERFSKINYDCLEDILMYETYEGLNMYKDGYYYLYNCVGGGGIDCGYSVENVHSANNTVIYDIYFYNFEDSVKKPAYQFVLRKRADNFLYSSVKRYL